MKRLPVILLAAMLLVFCAAVLSGCVAETPSTQAPVKASTQVVTPVSTSAATVVATGISSRPVASQDIQDDEFRVVLLESLEGAILPTLGKISEDLSKTDMVSLKTDSATLRSQADDYYNQLNDLEVSPTWQATKTNYLKSLPELGNTGDYYSKAAIAYQSGDFTTAQNYFEQGNTYMRRANEYLNSTYASIPK